MPQSWSDQDAIQTRMQCQKEVSDVAHPKTTSCPVTERQEASSGSAVIASGQACMRCFPR